MRWFDGFRRTQPQRFPGTRQRESPGNYTARKLREALFDLDINRKPSGEYPLKLPDLKEPGIRHLPPTARRQEGTYRTPVVEAAALEKADWETAPIPRARIAAWTPQWLSQVCPPGVMERTNPETKLVYQISQVEGTLKHRASMLKRKDTLCSSEPER